MSVDNQLHELTVRVSVLEEKNSNLEGQMEALKKEFDHSRDEHIRTHDKFQVRLSVIEGVVQDLKLNTELTKQSLATLEEVKEKMEESSKALTSIQSTLTRQQGFIAGIVFFGGLAWTLFDKYGGPLMKSLGF